MRPPDSATSDLSATSRATDVSLADVTERLMAEFSTCAGVSVVSRIVLDCRHELSGAHTGAAPEVVERLARQRLLGAVLDVAG